MRVTNEIKIYERDGLDVHFEDQHLKIESHWNEKSKIVIILNGVQLTVVADQLKDAIANSENWS